MVNRLYILGQTNDDKGVQLETLVTNLLQRRGCRDIKRNQLHAGGSEIDVTARKDIQMDGCTVEQYIICECKAYANRVALPDWLKFLGKYFASTLEKNNVHGIFVALSDVNGNVSSAYDTNKSLCPDVELITGDSLVAFIEEAYSIVSPDRIMAALNTDPDYPVHELSLAYYEHEVYWIVVFKEEFTVLSNIGKVLNDKEERKIVPLVSIKNHAYINLDRRNSSIWKSLLLNRACLCYIVQDENYSCKLSDFERFLSENKIDYGDSDDLVRILGNNPFISKVDDYYVFSPSAIDLIEFYRYNLQYEFRPLNIIRTSFYQDSIDSDFLKTVCAFQSGISIPDEMVDDCLFILKRSPSALLYAVTKDPMIAQGRINGTSIYPGIDKVHRDIFIRNLYIAFMKDSEDQNVIQALATDFNIVGVTTETCITVCTDDKSEKKFLFKLPLVYGNMDGWFAPIVKIED